MTDVTRADFRALGTGCVLLVADPARLDTARAAIDEQLAIIDAACSRFRDDSELMALNGRAGETVHVGPELFEAITLAVRAARVTGGDVDPTIGAALRVLGYDRDFGEVAGNTSRTAAPLITLRRIAGWERIELDADRSTVRIPEGCSLDLGATAKAWAADRAAAAAADAAGGGVLVSLGGDIAVAGPAPEDGWLVRVAASHASSLDEPGQTITMSTGGLATSSTTVRRWTHGANEFHHIIDPATSLPADDVWRSVSVAAATCADANIASTAAIIRGESAPSWLTAHALPARLVGRDGDIVHLNGWPEDGEDR